MTVSIYDYIVIGFYLAFMFLLGPIYKSFSRTSSDFFRGGGGMLWWVVGSSAFMTTFTAWAFTGGAAKAYETGTFFLVIFALNVLSLIFCYFFVVAKYRQMRIITVMEGVRKRFGKTSEQMLTWLLVLVKVLYGGAMLYAIAIFMSSVFNVPMPYMIIGLGMIITLMTVFGGCWSATAGDFVQMIVVVIITVVMSVLTLIKVGGVGAFIDQIPPHHRNWTLFDRPNVLVVFIITLFFNQCIQMNSLLEGAARFIFVKDGPSAKKAVLIQMAGLILLPIIWIVPPMMAAVWHPNIADEFPLLKNASEAAYVAMAMDLLPAGLFGLLVCGIFAATVTSLNSQLNVIGGSFVRNIYIQVIRPGAPEKEQITVGRIFMLIYGVIWILLGLGFQQVKGLELFDLLLLIAAATVLPLTVPLFLGIFFKKTPPWAGWSTMVAGFVPAAILGLLFQFEGVVQWLWQNPEMTTAEVIRMIWRTPDLNAREIGDLKLAITTGVVAAVSVGWFFFSMLFYRKDEKPYVDQVDEFFHDMNTPIQPEEVELGGHSNEARQCAVLGNLCFGYGIFMLLLIFVPNETQGRLIILCCGAVITGIGLLLKAVGKRARVKAADFR
jgi:solute:Na+ symporter, SSS family